MSRADYVGEKRFLFLFRLFTLTRGAETKEVTLVRINEELGFAGKLIEEIKHFLESEELVKSTPNNMSVKITEKGIYAIEDALAAPHRATRYFPPIKTIPMSSIVDTRQIFADAKRFAVLNPLKMRYVGEFLQYLKENYWQLNLDVQQKSIFQDALFYVEQESLSVKPKWEIILDGLEIIRNVLEGGSKTGIEQELLMKLSTLMS